MNYISILGSTGSIGTQTLEVVDSLDNISIIGLSANKNIELLYEQIIKYKPKIVCIMDKQGKLELEKKIKYNKIDLDIVEGVNGLVKVATQKRINLLVNAVVGSIGLIPTLEAIKHKKNIALANKETLVTAGEIVMREAKKNNVAILPIDSEHCAIYQCLQGNERKDVRKIILTASGGSFRDKTKKELNNVTLKDTLQHPNWSMGKKITVDSATLANKGLEVIEAKWLFGIDHSKIEVVVHRQSIVHSMVEYIDGSIIAQLGSADMRVPIQYCLTYPKRVENNFKKHNFFENSNLTFEKPDTDRFPALQYAYNAINIGGIMPTVFNMSNEMAVQLYLEEKIKFLDISRIIKSVMEKYSKKDSITYNIENILRVEEEIKHNIKNNGGFN